MSQCHLGPESQVVVAVSSAAEKNIAAILEIRDLSSEPPRVGVVLPGSQETQAAYRALATCNLDWVGLYAIRTMAAQDRMLESMGVFGVIARWIVQAHEAHSFEKVLRENIRNTIRNEAGAVAFGYGQLLGTCSGGRALAQFPGGSEFALIECFEREADFTAHVETQHFKIFRERISAFFLGDRAVTIKGYGRLRFDKLRSLDVVA